MWLPIPAHESLLGGVASIELPLQLPDAGLTSDASHPARVRAAIESAPTWLPAPWLHIGALLERRGPYDRRYAFKHPESGGYATREYGAVVQTKSSSEDGLFALVAKIGPAFEWWPLQDVTSVSMCIGVDAATCAGLANAATWLLNALTGESLGGVFVRYMAHSVVVEGSRGRIVRGVVLANPVSISRETMALATASGYDLVAGNSINAATAQTAIATGCEAMVAGELSRLQTAPFRLTTKA